MTYKYIYLFSRFIVYPLVDLLYELSVDVDVNTKLSCNGPTILLCCCFCNVSTESKLELNVVFGISESEIGRKDQGCCANRRRCIVISVLVVCLICIVAGAVFLGIYFGGKRSSYTIIPSSLLLNVNFVYSIQVAF